MLEGLLSGGMLMLRSKLQRSFANSPELKFLANPDVQFTTRLYTPFNIAPKDVRLRDPLITIMNMPGLYNRAKVRHHGCASSPTQAIYAHAALRVIAGVATVLRRPVPAV